MDKFEKFKEEKLTDPNEFEIKSDLSALYYKGRLLYMFVGNLEIDNMTSCFKSCLISAYPPEKAKVFYFFKSTKIKIILIFIIILQKLQCALKLIHDEKELFSYTGLMFSIEDTQNIYSWKSGGLIYPKEIGSYPFKFDGDTLTMVIKVSEENS